MSTVAEIYRGYFKEPVKPIAKTKDSITLPLKEYQWIIADYKASVFELEGYKNHYPPPLYSQQYYGTADEDDEGYDDDSA